MFRHSFLAFVLIGFILIGNSRAWADTWTSYADIGPTFAALEAAYPTLCKRYNLGQTVQGRDIWALRISDNMPTEEDEPEFKYVSTMHGDEITGTKLCMMLADYLLTNYGTDPQATNIVDEVDLWIVPLMNPDGYDKASRTRGNANGVDLNRDFPEYGEPNSTAGRQIETGVIMNWSALHTFTASANLHGGALVANYPFDNEDTGSRYSDDDLLLIWMAEEYSQHNLPMWNGDWYHGRTNGADWYIIDGGMQDWNFHFMGCKEITLELSDIKEPSASQIGQFWSDNRVSLMSFIETSLVGVRGIVTDGVSGLPVAATVRVGGRSFNDIYSDPDVGDYHRLIEPGTYDLSFEAAGYDPITVGDIAVLPGDATQQDVQMFTPPALGFPNGGEALKIGLTDTISWTGNAVAQYQVQYTDNADALQVNGDGFESGSLGPEYATGGNAVWSVTSGTTHTGTFSAQAGNTSDNQVTWMTRTVNGGDMSFWYRVSSEATYDFFNFYVDGNRVVHVSGNGSWTQYATTLSPGTHELKWEYTKDVSVSSFSDTAWVDDLQITDDGTVWTDVVTLTSAGASSTPWTPPLLGVDYKVRVRAVYDGGTSLGQWDDSDTTFSVVPTPGNGDFSDDGAVDLFDFALFQQCFEGDPLTAACAPGDLDGNGVVEVQDLDNFVSQM
jgi:carboxypeptidase D